MILPESYCVTKFYELGIRPKHNSFNGTYQCSCPICREGSSPNKRRCYYIPKRNLIFCHNCGWSGAPQKWIKELSGKTDEQIYKEVRESTYDISELIDRNEPVAPVVSPTLPDNCINLFDENQIEFYKDNKIVQLAVKYIKDRKIGVAINRPKALYLSLTDYVHKDRLIIPFYDRDGKIIHYQSRKLLDIPGPKYLSRSGNKSLFGLDKVDLEIPTIFLFEGPIDSFFTQNGVATAGITEQGFNCLTPIQTSQLNQFVFHKHIWVLDSQWLDKAARKKTEILLKQGEQVFLWPEKIGKKFKDFNDLAIATNKTSISPEFIYKNTFSGVCGTVKLAEIKRNCN